jgi:hypothetical protein
MRRFTLLWWSTAALALSFAACSLDPQPAVPNRDRAAGSPGAPVSAPDEPAGPAESDGNGVTIETEQPGTGGGDLGNQGAPSLGDDDASPGAAADGEGGAAGDTST